MYSSKKGLLSSEITDDRLLSTENCEADVVYRSRAIVEKYNDSIVWQDSVLCSQIGITLKRSKPIVYDKVVEKPILYSVYPNPTKSKIRISMSDIPKYPLTYIIQDILGRELYRLSENMTVNVHDIDMGKYMSGIYFLRILENNKEVYHHQIQLTE